jgi:hypothetical protein
MMDKSKRNKTVIQVHRQKAFREEQLVFVHVSKSHSEEYRSSSLRVMFAAGQRMDSPQADGNTFNTNQRIISYRITIWIQRIKKTELM